MTNNHDKQRMSMSTIGTMSAISSRASKNEGSVADIFTTLTIGDHSTLPERFADLKKELWRESMIQSWKEVLEALVPAVEDVVSKSLEIIPQIRYGDLKAGLSQEMVDRIKTTGVVIVKGGVPAEEALGWKQAVKEYATANKAHLKGFPPENIQIFEVYNSKSQIQARTHPALINTQKSLLSLWRKSDPSTEVNLQIPISYFDRLRIRHPGDSKFTLGPHSDGGSVERWEDPGFRGVYAKILEGGSEWKKHDPFDATPRIGVKQDMYNTPNACSVFRAWQGWTSLSSTGPGEGTLRVLPMLKLASAYILLRPFFRPINPDSNSLKFEDWILDLDSPTFPGSSIGKTQELNEKTHPHLNLAQTVIPIPKVEPGDQVYWHCDVVHAVENHHHGTGDSSVLYIPAVPLSVHNASYLRDQRINFLAGLPPPDFPGGEGESKFSGRGTPQDIMTDKGRQMLGLEKYSAEIENGLHPTFVEKVNRELLYSY